jgi:pyruvate/2-oxoglutarate dehydrogenase complex dihydrolipoamide acyltransferase (E2) component
MAAAAEALKQSPLARVKEEFGGKDKLVDKIVGVLDSGDESKDELRKRLLGVSNTKLIRLFSVASQTKQAGGHDKLVAATAEKLKRAKDKDYVAKLDGLSNGQLLDMSQAAARRNTAATPKTDGARPPVARAPRAAKPAVAAKAAAKPEKSAKAKKSAAAVKAARARSKASKR